MRIYKILPLLVFIAFCCCGCTVELDVDENELPSRTYISDNGYSITVPQNWQENDISESTVEFCAEDNQLSLTITSEFGGVDYYSMREIKDQLTEIIAADLFKTYDITDDEGGTKYFHRVLKGADLQGAKLVVDIYANQPFLTIRHYMVIVASSKAYKTYENQIDELISSFTPTYTEDEYLLHMEERREAARNNEVGQTDQTSENTTDEQEPQEE